MMMVTFLPIVIFLILHAGVRVLFFSTLRAAVIMRLAAPFSLPKAIGIDIDGAHGACSRHLSAVTLDRLILSFHVRHDCLSPFFEVCSMFGMQEYFLLIAGIDQLLKVHLEKISGKILEYFFQ